MQQIEKNTLKSNNGRGGRREGAGRKPGMVGKVKQTLAAKAREFADDALRALADIARDKTAPPAARVSASIALLDRGFGRPIQALEHGGASGGPIKLEVILIDAGAPAPLSEKQSLERDKA